MLYRQTAPQIFQTISSASFPLIISHENPDGDTLGASLALSHFLAKSAKPHKHFCQHKPAEYFSFLPGVEKIITDQSQINLNDHDLIITVDCGDLKRTGLEKSLAGRQIPLINIDHHQSNNNFGQHNLVAADASSTCEIIYNFFEFNLVEIDKYIATSLLTGILTDTMNFSNAGTTKDSLEISAKLLTLGAKINQIIYNLNQNKSLPALKLWGTILSRLEIEPTCNFAHTIITQQDLAAEKVSKEDIEGLSGFLTLLQDASFILVMTEEADDNIKGSLRTTRDEIDVAQIAAHFGGGGHKKAAGFKISKQSLGAGADWKNFIINAIITTLKN